MKRIILLLTLTIFICTGCYNFNNKSNEKNAPLLNFIAHIEPIRLDSSDRSYDSIPTRYFDQFVHVWDCNKNLALGHLAFNNKTDQDLYLIDLKEEIAFKIYSINNPYRIRDAVIGDQYIVWVETSNGIDWFIRSMDRKSGEIKLLDTGLYNVNTGGDWPSVAIEDNMIAYNLSKKGKYEMLSQVILLDLISGKKTILTEIEKEDTYFGRPDFKGNKIVWHRGEWTPNMYAESFVYNVDTGITKTLPSKANAIMPLLWNDYVLWIEYKTGEAEFKYVVQYNMKTNEIKYISDHSDYSFECWDLSLSNNKLTWRMNKVQEPTIHNMENQEQTKLPFVVQENDIIGNYLFWKNRNLDGCGLYVSIIDNVFKT